METMVSLDKDGSFNFLKEEETEVNNLLVVEWYLKLCFQLAGSGSTRGDMVVSTPCHVILACACGWRYD